MDLATRVRMGHRKTILPPNFSNTIELNDENRNPVEKISDRCSQVITKSFSTLHQQLNINRQYLNTFQSKLEKVYQLQALRGALKERQYKNLLQDIENKKTAAAEELRKINQENLKDYKEVMKQNSDLEELKANYEHILRKVNSELEKQKTQVQKLQFRNDDLKQKIKSLWKFLGSEVHGRTDETNQPSIMKRLKKQIKLMHRSKQNIEAGALKSKQSIISEVNSLYVTQQQISNEQSPGKNNSTSNYQIGLKQNHEVSRCDSKLNSSLAGYEDAIKRIEELEMSIIASKKCKTTNKDHSPSISDQNLRKQRIRERVEEVEYTIEMLKLFIVYLKSNDSTENKTELVNLRKVICYFEKVLKHKEDVLQTIREMSKNVPI